MRFAAASRFNASDYATAATAAANSLAKTFDAARKNAPDWTGLARTSMNTRSAERQTAMKAEADVATAGLKSFGQVKGTQIKGAYDLAALKTELKSKSRKAGRLGALGGFKMPKKSKSEYYNKLIEKTESMKQEVPEVGSGYQSPEFKPTGQHQGINVETPAFIDPNGIKPPTNPSSPAGVDTAQPTAPATSKPAGGNIGALNFQTVSDMAAQAGAKFPGLVAAQWQLESGGGTSQLATKHNNLFGQKGAGVSYNTKEDYGNGMVTVKDDFMSFGSPQESVNYLVDRWYKDFGKYKGVNNAGSAAEAANMLKQQGYATDPNYVNKLLDIRNRNMV